MSLTRRERLQRRAEITMKSHYARVQAARGPCESVGILVGIASLGG